MIIKEVSKSWTGEFDFQGLPDLTEEEIKTIKGIIRSAGDVISTLSSFPEELSSDARETIIGIVGFVMAEAKNNAILAVDNIIGNEAMRAPLENEFLPINLFGLNLKDSLIANLTPEEIKLAAEHYNELKSAEDSDEEPSE